MWAGMNLQQNFVETKLITKFAEFTVRVYKDQLDKETLVLSTQSLDISQPVLVRVHSECLTGDALGSLHCDCGQQLHKSLQMIKENGGVLIYLRQEGRGIGLFEKIKSYELQSQGYDTFEANIALGHAPDTRSYAMVKKVLEGLGITKIKILTNNPSKVSNIAKLGIVVTEIIPLVIKSNKHNKKYLEVKKQKFHHALGSTLQDYLYQCHVDNYQQVEEIVQFIKQKHQDPLLKIGIGINVQLSCLEDPEEIERVNRIVAVCEKNENLVSIIHCSFKNSKSILEDVKKIKERWNNFDRLQINDLKSASLSLLKKLSKLSALDIPLPDEDFPIVHDKAFRNFIRHTRSFILLDNSKGRGIQEPKEALMKKINILLGYGLNDITICGGFGPDELSIYFEIRRYYRLNFSIDAETKLKTGGRFDLQKIKRYLLQLIRFDDPNDEGISRTKKFLKEHRCSDWDEVQIGNREFMIHPKVFHAGHFPSSYWFARELCRLLKMDSTFCEVGCGSGVISCLAALENPRLQVTSTDINPYAGENTAINADRLGLRSRVIVVTGDVLDSIEPKEQFDTIFWALPFGFLDPGTEISLEEAQVFDPGYRAIAKLLQTGRKYLKEHGRLLLGFSSELGHYELLASLAQDAKASIRIVAKTTIQEEVPLQFEILELSYQNIEDVVSADSNYTRGPNANF